MLIELEGVTHIYELEESITALRNVDLSIDRGEFIGLVGHTGSGKSTLAQVMNGLIKPTEGKVCFQGEDISGDKIDLQDVRKKVGLVFQYPEHQLFEETVAEDIAFGPRNLGLDSEEIEVRVKESLERVGLDYDAYRDRSPFNLSGGQQRRIAIAGVLALKPEVLILDEPSAALDPQGRRQLLGLLEDLHQEMGITIVLITHRMEQVARLAGRVIVMDKGEVVLDDSPGEVFKNQDFLRDMALDLPPLTMILSELQNRGLPVRNNIFTLPEARDEILSALAAGSFSRGKESC